MVLLSAHSYDQKTLISSQDFQDPLFILENIWMRNNPNPLSDDETFEENSCESFLQGVDTPQIKGNVGANDVSSFLTSLNHNADTPQAGLEFVTRTEAYAWLISRPKNELRLTISQSITFDKLR